MAEQKQVKLTPEQEARADEFVAKWHAIGLATDPADRPRAEAGIRLAYKIAEQAEPKIVWCGSPLGNGLTRAIVHNLEAVVEAILDDRGKEPLVDSVCGMATRSLERRIWARLAARLDMPELVPFAPPPNPAEPKYQADLGDLAGPVWRGVVESVLDTLDYDHPDRTYASTDPRASYWDMIDRELMERTIGRVNRGKTGVDGKIALDAAAVAQLGDLVARTAEDLFVELCVHPPVVEEPEEAEAEKPAKGRKKAPDKPTRAARQRKAWADIELTLRDNVRQSIGSSGYGQHDASWLGFYDFFKEVCGLEDETAKLAGLWEIAKSAGWFLPHQDVCWVAERACELHRNAAGQLHNEAGPAFCYPDGFCVWRIDGIELDEQIVMRPQTQTIAQIEAEGNADVKSIRIDRFGWPRYLTESGAKELDRRANDVDGTVEVLYATSDGGRRLVATCPTGKLVVMGVPAATQTCEAAQATLVPDPFNSLART